MEKLRGAQAVRTAAGETGEEVARISRRRPAISREPRLAAHQRLAAALSRAAARRALRPAGGRGFRATAKASADSSNIVSELIYSADCVGHKHYHSSTMGLVGLVPVSLALSPSAVNMPVDLALGLGIPLYAHISAHILVLLCRSSSASGAAALGRRSG